MKLKTLMIIKAIVCITLAIPILAMPVFFYSIFGLALTPAGAFVAREYGASLIGNFLLTWFARDVQDQKSRKAILLGMTFYNGIGFIATLFVTLSGVANFLAWGPVALYLFFTVGFGYFLLKSPKG
jgi:hypothetical protein